MTAFQLLFAGETLYLLDQDKVTNGLIDNTDKIIESIDPNIEQEGMEDNPQTDEITTETIQKIDVNVKRDLVIVLQNLDDEDLDFLSKILQTIGRDISEILVVDLVKHPDISTKSLLTNTAALFSFGVPFTQLGFKTDLSPYSLKIASDKNYLYADDLKTIAKNEQNEKRLLWNALKTIL